MSEQEKLVKIKSGEIGYVGDHYINHDHNAHITKIVAILGRTLVRNKDGVKVKIENIMGYESAEVVGFGLDNNAVDLLSHACYVLNKTKNLIVNIDIIDYMRMTGLNVDDLSNKPRFVKSLENSCARMAGTTYKIKKNGITYGSSIILFYAVDSRSNLLTIVFNDSFNIMQNEDKIVHSLNLESKKTLKKEFSPAILDALCVNNYKKHSSQDIMYADLKWAVVSNTKKSSHLKQAYNEAFAELVNKGFLEHCYFDELSNKQTIVRYKFPKSNSLVTSENVNRAPVTIDQDATVVDCDSLSPEGVMKAIETTIAGLGVNPEYIDSVNTKEGWEAIEWVSEETNDKSASANSNNKEGSNEYDIFDDEFPF